jgi:hypothetical protein
MPSHVQISCYEPLFGCCPFFPFSLMKDVHPIFVHYNRISFIELTQNKLVSSVFVGYAILQLVAFAYVKLKYPDTFARNSKASGWFLTWMVSMLVSSVGIPFAIEILINENPDFTINTSGCVIATIFLSFLVVDLGVGSIFYPKRINLVAGWVHHSVYIYILLDFLMSGIPGMLGPYAMLEFPTFLLALGNLNPKWRTDLLFGAVFFATRIAYHAFFIYRYYQLCFGYSFFYYTAAVFPMHCFWFYSWVKGQMKKRK